MSSRLVSSLTDNEVAAEDPPNPSSSPPAPFINTKLTIDVVRSKALPSPLEDGCHRKNNAQLATAPATTAGVLLPRRPAWPWRRSHGCFFLRRPERRPVPRPGRLRREGLVFPADPARAGAAQHRRRAHPSEPDHTGAAVSHPSGVSCPVPAVHLAAAHPAAAASFVDTAGAAVAVPEPTASPAPAAVHPTAGAPPPAATTDPWRAASFLLQERPAGETMRKMLVFLQFALLSHLLVSHGNLVLVILSAGSLELMVNVNYFDGNSWVRRRRRPSPRSCPFPSSPPAGRPRGPQPEPSAPLLALPSAVIGGRRRAKCNTLGVL